MTGCTVFYSARNSFDPRHKCSNGLSACVAGIVTTVKQNKENKYGNFRRNLYIFLWKFKLEEKIENSTILKTNKTLIIIRTPHRVQYQTQGLVQCFQLLNHFKESLESFRYILPLNPYPWIFGTATERNCLKIQRIAYDVTVGTKQFICAARVTVRLYFDSNFKWHMCLKMGLKKGLKNGQLTQYHGST